MVDLRIPRGEPTASRAEQRKRLLTWRMSLAAAERDAWGRAIARALAGVLAEFGGLAVIGVYWPIRGEPALPAVDDRAFWGERLLALPRVQAPGRPLEFGRWPPGSQILLDRWGIGSPDPFEPIAPDVLVIPCVGYDDRGFRLGYGGGYYDRTLAARRVPTIGVAYERSRLDAFEPQAHDQPLDVIISERRVLRRVDQAG
jgi:5-formyltetrahydrofolate cyclo-ligase